MSLASIDDETFGQSARDLGLLDLPLADPRHGNVNLNFLRDSLALALAVSAGVPLLLLGLGRTFLLSPVRSGGACPHAKVEGQ